MQHRTAQRQALLPAARQRADNQIFLPLEVSHLKDPLDALLQRVGRYTIESGEQPDVFDDLEVVVQREFLRHVADVLAHGFRFAADVVAGYDRTARCRRQQST